MFDDLGDLRLLEGIKDCFSITLSTDSSNSSKSSKSDSFGFFF